MKIALLSDAWAPQINGVVTTLVELVRYMESAGHQVHVIEPGMFKTRPCPGYPGIDLAVRYRFELTDAGSFELYGIASYLDTSRKLFPASGPIDLSGTIFNPPRFKLRSGLGWSRSELMINLIANYIGGVTDNRLTETDKVSGLTTFDLSIRHHLGSKAGGIDIQATALNLFDKMPDRIRQASVIYAPYDSTNYSAIGRYLSLSLTKSF